MVDHDLAPYYGALLACLHRIEQSHMRIRLFTLTVSVALTVGHAALAQNSAKSEDIAKANILAATVVLERCSGEASARKKSNLVDAASFSKSSFFCMGLRYETYTWLRSHRYADHHILKAVRANLSVGFNPNDKRAIKNSAEIEKYDNKPSETLLALARYAAVGGETKLTSILLEESRATGPEEKNQAQKMLNDYIATLRDAN